MFPTQEFSEGFQHRHLGDNSGRSSSTAATIDDKVEHGCRDKQGQQHGRRHLKSMGHVVVGQEEPIMIRIVVVLLFGCRCGRGCHHHENVEQSKETDGNVPRKATAGRSRGGALMVVVMVVVSKARPKFMILIGGRRRWMPSRRGTFLTWSLSSSCHVLWARLVLAVEKGERKERERERKNKRRRRRGSRRAD